MAFYKYQTEGKTAAKFKEKNDQKLEGTVELAPNVSYNIQNVYGFKGLGSVFDGNYKMKRIVKRIDVSGMFVSADVVQLKAVSNPPPQSPKSEKEETKVKANKEVVVNKGDTLSAIALKLTGNANNWKKIEEANHAMLVARDSRNKNDKGHWIYPGQKLVIPGHLLK